MPDTIDDLFERYGPRYRTLVSVTGVLASFSMVVSGTIVNVAVPDVMGAFGVGQDQAQFLSTAYIATMTASQLLNAWFVSRFGPRNAFSLVIVNFMVGALICYTAPSIELIVVGRVMQGFSAGIVQPLVLVTVIQVFPPERRGQAAGIVISGLALALGFGPVFGGITIDAMGWRYIFLVPIPVVAVALLLGTFFMPAARSEEARGRFDWFGYGLLCLSIYSLMTALAGGNREGWTSDYVMGHWALGLLGAGMFVYTQVRGQSPLLDFKLFSRPAFAASIALAVVYGVGNFSITYAIPVFAQIVQGLTPTAAGFVALPAALLVMMVTPFTGRLSDVYSPIVIIVSGLGLFIAGAALLSGCDVNSSYMQLIVFGILCRLGMGCITPVLTAEALRTIPSDQINRGSGTLNFFRQLGGAFGINALVACMEWRVEIHSDAMTATQAADNTSTMALLRGAADLLGPTGLPADTNRQLAMDYLGEMISAQAQTLAFQDGFMLVAGVFAFAMAPAFVLSRARRVE